MNLWIILGVFAIVVVIGVMIFTKSSIDRTKDQLYSNKTYTFTYLCVFKNESTAQRLVTVMELDNVDAEVSLSQDGKKWWAKFTLHSEPKTNEYIKVESKLMSKTEELGGVYGYTDILDPDEKMIEVV